MWFSVVWLVFSGLVVVWFGAFLGDFLEHSLFFVNHMFPPEILPGPTFLARPETGPTLHADVDSQVHFVFAVTFAGATT